MILGARVAAATGRRVQRITPLHGGDLSNVCHVDFDAGAPLVAKTGPMVDVEARILRALSNAGAPAPGVPHSGPGLILPEYLEDTPASETGWRALGHSLRALLEWTGDRFGWDEDYAFGAVKIPKTPCDDWPHFWAERRLRLAPGTLPADIRHRLEALCHRLPDILPRRPPASLLHGDLWAGNVLFTRDRAVLIDPACYRGDGEVEIAMLTLFGHPPAAFYDGYGEMTPGFFALQPVYQLWPGLVHLRLFGAGYRGLVTRLLDQAGA